jgi:hypothetical protein
MFGGATEGYLTERIPQREKAQVDCSSCSDGDNRPKCRVDSGMLIKKFPSKGSLPDLNQLRGFHFTSPYR